MREPHIINYSREEFAEILGLETTVGIAKVEVGFSPMMGEWSLIVDFYEEDGE